MDVLGRILLTADCFGLIEIFVAELRMRFGKGFKSPQPVLCWYSSIALTAQGGSSRASAEKDSRAARELGGSERF